MNNKYLYYFWFLMLLIMSFYFFFIGMYLLDLNKLILLDWELFNINSCSFMMTIIIDWMSMMFSSCVFMISSMVILYSYSYMTNDLYKVRFLYLVLLFILSMFMMIMSPNLLSILVGWDGLGLVSYCLVIYFQNIKSYNAGMLTILINRLGDVAILISITLMMNLGSWHFLYSIYYWESWMNLYLYLLVLAGFTKSAQIPFSAWLPAAMAAPTPVSSLVHSSTLVTTGVYLLIRFSNLFNYINCYYLLMLSLLTMFMSGINANYEFDLKKIIALSTLSQLGLMMSILFMKYNLLSFFHLLTHAFFKALLFLCAGIMIHCMNNSQDIRHMGNLMMYMPMTISCFCISSFSLCGFPFLSGFYSKDFILEIYTLNSFNMLNYFLYYLSIGLTVSYSFRLIFFCLYNYNNSYVFQNYFENKIMYISLMPLMMLSIMSGSMFMWLIFNNIEFIFLSFILKINSLIFILVGILFGIIMMFNNKYIFKFKNMFVMMFFSYMWFLPILKTSYMYSKSMNMFLLYNKNMDFGWFESIFSKMILIIFSWMNLVMNMLYMNNIKIFMFMFFFVLMLFII
uniref:NADH-ubiquinone oxidoreductase chain 5 n=1 Tax=Aenictopecheidae sp. PJ-2015 TaxID=1663421 RepID=A0A3S6CGJ0_9HEMI|nr:NADH dehydrogenase subunit 5 [Aenictopecheidae sp. PJ-2015]